MVGRPGHRDHLAGHDLVRVDSVEAGHSLHAPEGADTDLERYRTIEDKFCRKKSCLEGSRSARRPMLKRSRASADKGMETVNIGKYFVHCQQSSGRRLCLKRQPQWGVGGAGARECKVRGSRRFLPIEICNICDAEDGRRHHDTIYPEPHCSSVGKGRVREGGSEGGWMKPADKHRILPHCAFHAQRN